MCALVFCLAGAVFAGAQEFSGPGRPGFDGPPMERAFHDRQFGRWWNDPRLAQQLGITEQQKHQMDQIFLEHKLKLIDLQASLEKQETLLRPMIEADQPDEGKILSQIDAVAQARADLEKENARMLFALRRTLTAEQWQKLKTLRAERMRHGFEGGPGMWRQRRPDRPGQPGAPTGPQGQQQPGQAPAPPQ